jgi:TRAP-type transport system periplasmic protein
MRRIIYAALGMVCLASIQPASAQLKEAEFRVLVQISSTPQAKDLEAPFWNETVPKNSAGKIKASLTYSDQAALADADLLRLLKLGAFDFASFDISKMAGDDPRFEGCDLSGVTSDTKTARAACEAYRAVLNKLLEEKWNVKLLAIGTAPPQSIWCKPAITGLSDLRGKKIRVFNRTMNDFAKALGAIPVNITFAEVVPALQQGVIDCGVTGNAVGNVAGWPEVTRSILPVSLGWSINAHGVNLTTWNKLDQPTKDFLQAEFRTFEDKFWTFMADATADADNCNVGRSPCRLGKMANMKLVPLSDADKAQYKTVIEEVVVRGWAGRVGANAAKEWDETVGKVVGMKATAK